MNRQEKLDALHMALGDEVYPNPEEVLAALEAQGVTIYLKKVTRRRRAQAESVPMTPLMREAIRAYYNAAPGLPLQKVAVVFNTNIGRVSEALR